MLKTIFALILVWSTFNLHAQTLKRLQFKTKLDRFELLLNGNTATIDGKPADLNTFRDLMPLLTKDLGEECPGLRGTSDVTVTFDSKMKARSLYIEQGVVTDGEKCLFVSGEGLLYFPLHKQWFLGNKQDGITFGNTLTISRDGNQIVTFTRKGKVWSQPDTEFHPDWDFLSKFENSLSSFNVKMHGNLSLAKEKPSLVVRTNNQTYRLHHITSTLWALEKPGTRWLVISNDWGQFFDLQPSQFEDHRADKIRFILDVTKSADERVSALNNMETGWSRALRDMYVRLLQNSSDDARIHKIALDRIKTKPNLENAGPLVDFLLNSQSLELKKLASQILRIQNPKGSIFEPNQPTQKQSMVIQEWSRWWQKVRPAE